MKKKSGVATRCTTSKQKYTADEDNSDTEMATRISNFCYSNKTFRSKSAIWSPLLRQQFALTGNMQQYFQVRHYFLLISLELHTIRPHRLNSQINVASLLINLLCKKVRWFCLPFLRPLFMRCIWNWTSADIHSVSNLWAIFVRSENVFSLIQYQWVQVNDNQRHLLFTLQTCYSRPKKTCWCLI